MTRDSFMGPGCQVWHVHFYGLHRLPLGLDLERLISEFLTGDFEWVSMGFQLYGLVVSQSCEHFFVCCFFSGSAMVNHH